ncbi:MAG: hypothetical protein HYT87_05860 [Nitrospirae bacterium]|nr:hypothetical protein [Nitrospirota bacterium]
MGVKVGLVGFAVLVPLTWSPPARAELFIEGYGGKAWHFPGRFTYETTFRETRDTDGARGQVDSGETARASVGGAEWDDFSLEPPIYYGYRGGYFLASAPRFGLAFDLIHSKARLNRFPAADASSSAVRPPALTKFEISHGLNLLMAVAFVRTDPMRIPRSRSMTWRIYSGVGIGPAVPHPEVELAGVLHQGYEFDGNDWSGELIGGLRLQIWKGLSLYTEYKFSGIHLDLRIPGGSAVTNIYSHHLALGTGWSF